MPPHFTQGTRCATKGCGGHYKHGGNMATHNKSAMHTKAVAALKKRTREDHESFEWLTRDAPELELHFTSAEDTRDAFNNKLDSAEKDAEAKITDTFDAVVTEMVEEYLAANTMAITSVGGNPEAVAPAMRAEINQVTRHMYLSSCRIPISVILEARDTFHRCIGITDKGETTYGSICDGYTPNGRDTMCQSCADTNDTNKMCPE